MHRIDCRLLILCMDRFLQIPHTFHIFCILPLLVDALCYGLRHSHEHFFLLCIPLFHCIGKVSVFRQQFRAHFQIIHISASGFHQKMSQICLAVIRIFVQDTLRIFLCFFSIPILQEIEHSLFQIKDLIGSRRRSCGSLCLCFLISGPKDLVNTIRQVLDKAQFPHIHRLQTCKFRRQIISIHIFICRDQCAVRASFFLLFPVHDRQETAPFIAYPDRFKIILLRSECDQHFGRLQCCKDVRLIILPQLIFQCDRSIEHLDPLIGQSVVDLPCQYGILCSLIILIRFFIADEHIERLFTAYDL